MSQLLARHRQRKAQGWAQADGGCQVSQKSIDVRLSGAEWALPHYVALAKAEQDKADVARARADACKAEIERLRQELKHGQAR